MRWAWLQGGDSLLGNGGDIALGAGGDGHGHQGAAQPGGGTGRRGGLVRDRGLEKAARVVEWECD